MSIVDATTSLATTWTEYDRVDFTAGTLNTNANMITYIETHLQRGTIGAATVPSTAQVQWAITRAKQELLATKAYAFARRYAYASTVAGTYRYALPPDFQSISGLRDADNDRDLIIWQPHIFNMKYPDPSAMANTEPTVFTVKHMELWCATPADGVYTLELEYERSGDDNTQTDVAWLPQLERFRCCDFAIADLLDALHDPRADKYWARWGAGVQRSKRADAKQKWKGKPAAISVFQEYAARTYAEDPEDY